MANVVGPGSVVQEDIAPKPTLDNATEYEYVTILNPLPDDFQVNVAQDVPVNMPFQIRQDTSGKTQSLTHDERDAQQVYGLSLKNPDHQAKKYIYNRAIIPAGQTMNFKGNEAQVVVRQLVNEIMQRSGQRRLMADPTLRKQIEDQIIQRRGSVQEILDEKLVTPTQRIDEAVTKSNEVQDAQAFPGLSQTDTGPGTEDPSPGTGITYDPGSNPDRKKPVGRPKKANS